MNIDQMKNVMKYHLNNFNDEGVDIDDNTIHNQVLSDSDGFGRATSMRIYKAAMRWTLKKEKHKDKKWPQNWMKMSVDSLASKLL